MVHPEFEANVEQIHLTRVDEPSQVDAVQFNFMRDDGVQGEVGVSPPLAEAEVSEDYISEAGSEGVCWNLRQKRRRKWRFRNMGFSGKRSWSWIS